ncbi:valyl-tRNA synthetase [Rhodoligotrophos appendicifer]|uniref:valine--tRNA ligase n=1 Tax=Rhodoligotrophos appendicifer TaxID=987056 RepID=UPI001184C49D|nr:valine--tRNA ligase [Rhodoligotrophos appendicifer]
MLDKTYKPQDVEGRIYESWEASGAFKAGLRQGAECYSIVIPPPNVTGSLHMGHALNNTIQDILVRFERMRGKDVLWQPGTDHAGIATQMVVERQLQERQEPSRWSMGREAFIARVWEWKAISGGTIINQLKRLGASCDWSRERFTMDEGLSLAVVRVFVQLYKQGLIYKDKRLVNWDPKLLTAISDLEVLSVETKGHLWHFNYPIKDQPGRFITVATTRPETMLGDTGVAVHPEDERYKDLVGKSVVLPLVGREIPIVADEYADPEQGSGAVKITPAHDFNDFEVGKRHDLRQISIFDQHGRLDIESNHDFLQDLQASDELGETLSLHMLDRFEARKRIVARMEAAGLLDKVDDHVNMVPFGDRSNVIIEPFLTEQWYVDAATLAQPAIEAVETGKTKFVPANWSKTYFDWMRNIQPWCISRQLWWGHQIPAWYGPDGEIFVEETEEEAFAAAEAYYGSRVVLDRDPDVLDTWFSSALWPFSTLGWPDQTTELKRFYPTSALVTGFDIIFFWVARMMMMGLHFMKDVPFPDVYIHGIVRDERGQKMSKSKGNVVDPLELIDEFGADALRFTMASLATPGRDVKPSKARIESSRNFATKLWNAARFCEMNGCIRDPEFEPGHVQHSVNRWIIGEANRAARSVSQAIEQYRVNDAALTLYQFVWNVFCDWYVELIKPLLNGEDVAAKAEARATAAYMLDEIVTLLHPFMPFVTEELWQRLGESGAPRRSQLILAPWPSLTDPEDAAADEELSWVIRMISEIRSVRAEMNVPAGAQIECVIVGADATIRQRVVAWDAEIRRLARLKAVAMAETMPKGAVQIVLGDAVVGLPIADVIDLKAEKSRLGKDLTKLRDEIGKINAKLGNAAFMAKAPEHVVEEQQERRTDAEALVVKTEAAIRRLDEL